MDGDELFSMPTRDRTRSHEFRLKKGKLSLAIRKKCLTMREVKHRNGLPT